MNSASFEDSPAPVKSKPSQIPPDSFFAGGYFRDSEVGHRPVQNHPPQLPNCSPGTGPRDKKRVPLSDPVPHFLFLFTSPYSLFPRGRPPSPGDIPAVLCSVVRMPAGPVPAAGLAPAAVAPRPGAGSRPAPRLPRPLLRRPDRRRRFPLRSPLARPPDPGAGFHPGWGCGRLGCRGLLRRRRLRFCWVTAGLAHRPGVAIILILLLLIRRLPFCREYIMLLSQGCRRNE